MTWSDLGVVTPPWQGHQFGAVHLPNLMTGTHLQHSQLKLKQWEAKSLTQGHTTRGFELLGQVWTLSSVDYVRTACFSCCVWDCSIIVVWRLVELQGLSPHTNIGCLGMYVNIAYFQQPWLTMLANISWMVLRPWSINRPINVFTQWDMYYNKDYCAACSSFCSL